MTHPKMLPDFGPAADEAVRAACASFPVTFALAGHPGKTFRASERASYVSRGQVMVYTQRLVTAAEYESTYGRSHRSSEDLWLDFAKGTVDELRAAIVPMPVQHCPVYPCSCERCRTGIDMGLVRLTREREMARRYTTEHGERARLSIIDDCTTVLEHDARYPEVSALALARLQSFTGFSFR